MTKGRTRFGAEIVAWTEETTTVYRFGRSFASGDDASLYIKWGSTITYISTGSSSNRSTGAYSGLKNGSDIWIAYISNPGAYLETADDGVYDGVTSISYISSTREG